MTATFQCGDNPALVGYVYGECEPAERRAIDQHLLVCPACAAEVAALDSTRGHLAAWTPPDAKLGFRIVADAPADLAEARPSNVLRPARWWSRPMPAWAQAAAAAVIFAAGVSLGVWRGNASFDTPPQAAAQQAAAATTVAPVAAPAGAVSARDLAALEQRLRSELAQLRTGAPTTVAAPQAASASERRILAQVRALIDESEQRQQRQLALRTAQVVRDFDSQRRVDLQNVRSIVGQVEGSTGAEIARQQQTLQYLMRVSQQK
jgi:hypothetical protein